jgi:alkyl sulfatase BDS1-like metallo-beta-lactamase superfamily hydrolase
MSRFSIGSTAVGLGSNFFMTTEVMMLTFAMSTAAMAQNAKPPSEVTKAANARLLKELPFDNVS